MSLNLKMPCSDLSELLPVLKRGAQEFLKRAQSAGLQVKITQTYRSIDYQNSLYAKGRTKSGVVTNFTDVVTNCIGGQSPHNFRYAFDICKNVKGHEWDDDVFFRACGKIWENMGGEWGGSWKSFIDKPHFQFGAGLTDYQLINGSLIPTNAKMPWELPTQSTGLSIKKELPVKLKLGSKSELVNELQRLLVKNGFSLIIDGDFGNKTLVAVKNFQSQKGITSDGIVGIETWDKLNI